MSWPVWIAAPLGGYILGSIPFGLVLCYIAGYGDIRQIGSGNIGATNVLRTGNKLLALLTLLLDSGKGAIAAYVAYEIGGPDMLVMAGAGAVFGHNFPIWLKFKGGKGVATSLGTLFVVSLPVGLAAGATWLISAALFRISSLAALIAFALAPIFGLFLPFFGVDLSSSPLQRAQFALFLAVLVFVRHHANIRRLLKGEEPKIGSKKEKAADTQPESTT